jgi:hypothetical protein
MAQTTSNGEWLDARNPTRAECEIFQGKRNTMAPTVTKEIKYSRRNQQNQAGENSPLSTLKRQELPQDGPRLMENDM